jgi:hypothetical protein
MHSKNRGKSEIGGSPLIFRTIQRFLVEMERGSSGGLNDGESSEQCCPSCTRGYEMPRRYVIKNDDMDYAPIPRLLSCLHSCCTSCCEEMYQRSEGKSGGVGLLVCPTCRSETKTKNVRALPLDAVALQQIYELGGAPMMA